MNAKIYIEGACACNGLAAAEKLTDWFAPRSLRRLEDMARVLLYCSCEALEAAGQSIGAEKDFGLALGIGCGSLQSTCKFMDSIIQDGDALSSPTAFAGSVHNAAGYQLALFLNLRGPCVTSGQFNTSFGAALLTAQSFLWQGMAPRVVLAVADVPNPVVDGLERTVLSQTVPAEAPAASIQAAAFVLTAQQTEAAKGRIDKFKFGYSPAEKSAFQMRDWQPGAARLAADLCNVLQQGPAPFTLTENSLGVQTILTGEVLYACKK